MRRLFAAFFLSVLAVAPNVRAQAVPPPEPAPHDCAVDEGACVDEYYFCLNDCEGKNGDWSYCHDYYCPDEYNACLYGTFHTYEVQTHSDTRTRVCVELEFQFAALHAVIIDRTLTYRDQICPDSTIYTILLSDVIDSDLECYYRNFAEDVCQPDEPIVRFPGGCVNP